jgi:hypothetical protein
MRRRDFLGFATGAAVSAAAPLPRAVRARHKKMPVIGYLNQGPAGPIAISALPYPLGLGKAGVPCSLHAGEAANHRDRRIATMAS